MAFTYDVSKLATSPLFQVRFRLGDTSASAMMLQDEEITFLLGTVNADVLRTCAICCDSILAKLASSPAFTLGPYKEDSGKLYDQWVALRDSIQKEIIGYVTPKMIYPKTAAVFAYDMMSQICCEEAELSES